MSRRRRQVRGSLLAVVAVLVVMAALIGFLRQDRADRPASSAAPGHIPAGTLDPAAASAALGALAVRPKGRLTGYERECGEGQRCVFGPAWSDVDRNSCDQRNDVLRRDLTDVEIRPGTQGCVVIRGTLADPYSGRTVPFTKSDAQEIPIDHVVPLAAAWRQGARDWPAQRREEFANDLGNLIATTREENSAKGDSTAEEWVPENRGFGCPYARVTVTVKQRYGLSVTAAEADALRGLLATC